MGQDLLGFDRILQEALRSVVREALTQVAARGLPGNHHFFISFRSDHPGVVMPPYLRAQYPTEMTIVLQHQYSGLGVSGDAFSISLTFNNVPAHLTVPFAALTRFVDPSVNFGLQLTPSTPSGPLLSPAADKAQGKEAEGRTTEEARRTQASDAKDAARSAADGESPKVVALDSFRKS
jgi:hypothetical protein